MVLFLTLQTELLFICAFFLAFLVLIMIIMFVIFLHVYQTRETHGDCATEPDADGTSYTA
jgi:uncharacterized integral membrane protein